MALNSKGFKATVLKAQPKMSAAGKPYTKCTIRTSKKDKNGEWTGEFWDAMIFDVVQDKDKIEVQEFTVDLSEWTDNSGNKRKNYTVMIWKFTGGSTPPAPIENPFPPEQGDFAETPNDDDTLPF